MLSTCARIAGHLARGESRALREVLDGEEPNALARALRRQQMSLLVRPHAGPALSRAIAALPPLQRVPRDAFVAAHAEVESAFSREGIGSLLLKGVYLADRFGAPAREQLDLDLLVRRAEHPRALRVLRRLGYRPHRRDFHSRTLTRGAMAIDLHHTLRGLPAYQLDERGWWGRAVFHRLPGGRTVRALSDGDHVTLLVLSAFEDIGFGSAKLKQLLDLFLLLRAAQAVHWPAFLAARDAENAGSVCREVLGMVLALFEAEEELPELTAALRSPRSAAHGTPASRDAVIALLGAPEVEAKRWFASRYPGSLSWYRVWHTAADFPRNLTRPGRLRALRLNLAIARERLSG